MTQLMVQLCHSRDTGPPQWPAQAQRVGWERPWHAPTARLDNGKVDWGTLMTLHSLGRAARCGSLVVLLAFGLSACGGGGGSGLFGGKRGGTAVTSADGSSTITREGRDAARNSKITDVFARSSDPNTTVEVNKYLWTASLDVLNFLPIEQVDPFTGVIVTGYGTPPGSGRAYRATIYVQDPALDARSLKVALQTRGGGPVAPETARAVEDAILSRARQLRIQDSGL